MTGLAVAIVLMVVSGFAALVSTELSYGLAVLAFFIAGFGVHREYQDYKHRRGGWR